MTSIVGGAALLGLLHGGAVFIARIDPDLVQVVARYLGERQRHYLALGSTVGTEQGPRLHPKAHGSGRLG